MSGNLQESKEHIVWNSKDCLLPLFLWSPLGVDSLRYREKNSFWSNHLVKSEVQWAMTVSDGQTAIIPPQPTILISVQGISILHMQKEGCPHTSSLSRCYVLACPIQWKTDAKGCMTCGCSKYAYVLSTFNVLNIEILVLITIQRCTGANMTKRPCCRQIKLIWWIIFALG